MLKAKPDSGIWSLLPHDFNMQSMVSKQERFDPDCDAMSYFGGRIGGHSQMHVDHHLFSPTRVGHFLGWITS
jgi:hypothetical protein